MMKLKKNQFRKKHNKMIFLNKIIKILSAILQKPF